MRGASPGHPRARARASRRGTGTASFAAGACDRQPSPPCCCSRRAIAGHRPDHRTGQGPVVGSSLPCSNAYKETRFRERVRNALVRARMCVRVCEEKGVWFASVAGLGRQLHPTHRAQSGKQGRRTRVRGLQRQIRGQRGTPGTTQARPRRARHRHCQRSWAASRHPADRPDHQRWRRDQMHQGVAATVPDRWTLPVDPRAGSRHQHRRCL